MPPSSAWRRSTAHGNLNVSKFGPKLAGAGGFINISQNAKKVVFVGTFGAGRLRIAVREGRLVIIGRSADRANSSSDVEHVTFAGAYAVAARAAGAVCHRALRVCADADGLELIEVAPGIDIERDILALMDFKPLIPREPPLMDARIFRDGRDGPAQRHARDPARPALHL